MNIRACLCVDARRQVNSWSRVHPWLICLFLFSIACSKPTGSDTASIHGKVVLEGQTNHSGVEVRLYLPAELDPKIVALNQKHPNIGVPISQHTEFDHRFANEVSRTTTDRDGSFELKDVPQGQYVLVAQKEGYGWKYVFSVSPTSQIPHPISLGVERKVAGLLAGDATWEAGRHYIITGDVTVPRGVTLTIEPGVWVRFDGYYKLKVEGTLKALGEPDNVQHPADMIVFTSNQGLTSQFLVLSSHFLFPTSHLAKAAWNRIEFDEAEDGSLLSCAKIEWASRGVYCIRSSPLLRNLVIRHCADSGVGISSGSDPQIEGNWISDCKIGIAVEAESDPLISGNVITGSQDVGISVKISSSPRIENNWLVQNSVGIRVLLGCNPVIVHNEIVDGQYGVSITQSQVTLS